MSDDEDKKGGIGETLVLLFVAMVLGSGYIKNSAIVNRVIDHIGDFFK